MTGRHTPPLSRPQDKRDEAYGQIQRRYRLGIGAADNGIPPVRVAAITLPRSFLHRYFPRGSTARRQTGPLFDRFFQSVDGRLLLDLIAPHRGQQSRVVS